MSNKRKSYLALWIFGSIIAAIVLAFWQRDIALKLHVGGVVFLRLLKMVVVPLVVTSVMSGILGLGDIRKLGRPGGAAIAYYLSTTILAVLVGLAVVNVIKPGIGANIDQAAIEAASGSEETKANIRAYIATETHLHEDEITGIFPALKEDEKSGISTILENLVLMLFTDNLFGAAVNGDLLPLIVFSIFFAGLLTTMDSRVNSLTDIINQVNNALMSFVLVLMRLAPIGIFCLIASLLAETDDIWITLQKTASYSLAVLIGLGIHALVTLPIIYWGFTRRNPYRYVGHMSEALLTAFSTASSTATLPITMQCTTNKGGVSRRSTEFVLPLGATINMDGTALYEAVAAIFIAQAIGEDLSLAQQAVVAITATLAAIGAAGIPHAGLVTMLIVLNAVDLDTRYIALVLPVDWLLDRFRTAVNVFGDSIGAAVVDGTMPQEE